MGFLGGGWVWFFVAAVAWVLLVVLFCLFGFFNNTNEEMELQRGFLFCRRKKRKKHEKKKQHEYESPARENESAIWQLEFILIFSSGEPLAINSDTELVFALSLLSFLCD